jgi:MFS family permease
VAAVGLIPLTRIEPGSSYSSPMLPALLLGVGLGTAFMAATSLATTGVQPRYAGVASAMVNTSQQAGGAIGTTLLNTIAAFATTSWPAAHAAEAKSHTPADFADLGAVHGYTTAIWWAIGILAAAAAASAALVKTTGHHGTAAESSGSSTHAPDTSPDDAPALHRHPAARPVTEPARNPLLPQQAPA